MSSRIKIQTWRLSGSKMKHLHHKPGSFKEAQEREHDKVMGPRRRGDASEDLGGFPGPGGRMGAQEQEQKRGCPPSCREYLGKRLWGSKGQSHHCSLAGVGRRGRMTSWPAQVSRRLILENNWDALWVSGAPESPARAWGLCRSLGWGPATPSLPWFFPVSGLCTRHFFLLAAANPFL